jgi:hypothetical protein
VLAAQVLYRTVIDAEPGSAHARGQSSLCQRLLYHSGAIPWQFYHRQRELGPLRSWQRCTLWRWTTAMARFARIPDSWIALRVDSEQLFLGLERDRVKCAEREVRRKDVSTRFVRYS